MRVGTPHFSDNDLPRFSRTTPLGKRRKSLAFFVVALGIISFFWPLITTDPPVLGKTQWSAWNVVCQIYQGNLPNRKLSDTCERCDRQWVLALFYVPKLPHRPVCAHRARVGSSVSFSICNSSGPARHDGRDCGLAILEMGRIGLRTVILWSLVCWSCPLWSVHVSVARVDGRTCCYFTHRGPGSGSLK